MVFRNRWRFFVARLLIAIIHYPWRASEKLLGKQFPVKEHYYIMKFFRTLGCSFPVTIAYSNLVSTSHSIGVEKKSITLQLDLCENNHQWYFRLQEMYEIEWIKLIGFAMENAKSFIDVGSNIGVFALTIAQAFPDRRIVAIEPLPSNYLKLVENIRLNHLSNIEPLRAAVTENNKPVRFYVNPIHDGGGSIMEPREYRTGDVRLNTVKYQERHPEFTPIVDVETVRLDDIITSTSVLKIDVEGAEISVLKSGINSLQNGLVDLMVVEVTNTSINDIIVLLDNAGFDCFIYGQKSPLTDVSQFNRRLGNVLCIRRQSHIYDSILTRATAGEL